jgi:hypothetical protein
MQMMQEIEQKFLRTASRSKFETIFGSGMRPLFAILGLLLCLIATQADDPRVIKDSEAVQYPYTSEHLTLARGNEAIPEPTPRDPG